MIYEKTERFAVAIREDGMFFGLEETFSTTSPFHVFHPENAYKIFPQHPDEPLRSPEYYFENSYRMKSWLEDHKMVWVTQKIIAEVEP